MENKLKIRFLKKQNGDILATKSKIFEMGDS